MEKLISYWNGCTTGRVDKWTKAMSRQFTAEEPGLTSKYMEKYPVSGRNAHFYSEISMILASFRKLLPT